MDALLSHKATGEFVNGSEVQMVNVGHSYTAFNWHFEVRSTLSK